jgi:hypothetical protein
MFSFFVDFPLVGKVLSVFRHIFLVLRVLVASLVGPKVWAPSFSRFQVPFSSLLLGYKAKSIITKWRKPSIRQAKARQAKAVRLSKAIRQAKAMRQAKAIRQGNKAGKGHMAGR